MYLLEANFLCFLGYQNLHAKFSHFIISKINSKLQEGVNPPRGGFFCNPPPGRGGFPKQIHFLSPPHWGDFLLAIFLHFCAIFGVKTVCITKIFACGVFFETKVESPPPSGGEEFSAILGCSFLFYFCAIFGAKILLNWKVSNHNAFFFTIEIR